ncbi:uncharacterized protein VTP21DRAFT_7956 [Calcarisporiella thermophila]|uniref:uncharacterized protein n=1 Tax=Calcarisporiella thermophila TaxID=911321 RepID=UPI0037437E4E
MSNEDTSLTIKYLTDQLNNLVKESEENSRMYYKCLTTNIYGKEYLDPAKCEANNFDPIKACNEEDMRYKLLSEYCDGIRNLVGWRETINIIFSVIPEKYKKKQTGRSLEILHIPDTAHMRVEKRSRNKILSSVSKAAQRIIPRKNQKHTGKQPSSESLFSKAYQLIGHEVTIGDSYAKVIAVKATEDSVTLEVKEEVEEGIWDQYEIEYDTIMKPR